MRIHLVAVGKKMPEWVDSGFLEFRKRTPPELQIKLVEITPSVRNKTTPVQPLHLHILEDTFQKNLPKLLHWAKNGFLKVRILR